MTRSECKGLRTRGPDGLSLRIRRPEKQEIQHRGEEQTDAQLRKGEVELAPLSPSALSGPPRLHRTHTHGEGHPLHPTR